MLTFNEKSIDTTVAKGKQLLLVGDIGGTNCNFGLFQKNDGRQRLLHIYHIPSKQVTDFPLLINDLITVIRKRFQGPLDTACIAAAGVLSECRDIVRLTNLPLTIDAHAIMKLTRLSCVVLANDFEIIGYGITQIAPKDLVAARLGQPRVFANRGIIGAGTGLGKCMLHWDYYKERYLPCASEGGHGDVSIQSQVELDLLTFIRDSEKRTDAISWEDLLSGAGIKRIYTFFKYCNNSLTCSKKIVENGPHPDEIFRSRNLDSHAHMTYELYAKLYARCAKNFALDTLALGGIYISGGIATHNVQMFKERVFLHEFLNNGKQRALLEKIPVIVIADYYVSLYGAAEFMRVERPCATKCLNH